MEEKIKALFPFSTEEFWVVYIIAAPGGDPITSGTHLRSEGGAQTLAVTMEANSNQSLKALGLPETAKAYAAKVTSETTYTVLPEESLL